MYLQRKLQLINFKTHKVIEFLTEDTHFSFTLLTFIFKFKIICKTNYFSPFYFLSFCFKFTISDLKNFGERTYVKIEVEVMFHILTRLLRYLPLCTVQAVVIL